MPAKQRRDTGAVTQYVYDLPHFCPSEFYELAISRFTPFSQKLCTRVKTSFSHRSKSGNSQICLGFQVPQAQRRSISDHFGLLIRNPPKEHKFLLPLCNSRKVVEISAGSVLLLRLTYSLGLQRT